MEKEMVSEVKSYKCNWCGKLYSSEERADECAFIHARYNLANSMLEKGCTLSSIKYRCGFHWDLKEEQKEITKYECFIVSHWQCCDKPAYQIASITEDGYLKLWGKGSWDGYYGDEVRIERIPEAHPVSELFIDPR